MRLVTCMKADSIKSGLESYASTVNNFILAFIEGKPKELYQAHPIISAREASACGHLWYLRARNARGKR